LTETVDGLELTLTDEGGVEAQARATCELTPARDAARQEDTLRQHLGKLGTTPFEMLGFEMNLTQPWFVPASVLNALRRDAVDALLQQRTQAYRRPLRGTPVEPPVQYPEDTLTYLANVYNHQARDFYREHGVNVIASAYESHEETGEVSLMITKHCVRWSMSLCPKQAKGVTGVQGTVRAEPLTLINGNEKLTLRFDCKPCEMHVVGALKKSVQQQRKRDATGVPMQFYRQRPARVS
jgi:putative protease